MRQAVVRAASLAAVALLLVAETTRAHDSGFGLARYQPDGALDPSFGAGGLIVIRSAERSFVANALALQTDAKIVVGGMASDASNGTVRLALARYNADGTPDSGFAGSGMTSTSVGDAGAEANAVAVQPDGMIVVAGTAFSSGSAGDAFFVARFTPAGSLDRRFGTGGITTTHVGAGASTAAALALTPSGQIVLAGTAFSNGSTDDDFAVARYTFDGHLDATFGQDGRVTTDFGRGEVNANPSLDRAGALAQQTDGKIVVAGFTRGDRPSFAAVRYNLDGSLDAGFGNAGKAQVAADQPQVFGLALQDSGDIVLAGSVASANRGTAPFALARLRADGHPDETFGAGGLITTTFEGSRSGARSVVVQPDGKLIMGGARFGAPSAQGDPIAESGFALVRYNPDGSVDSGFGTGGKTLTSMGDAGATPLSLAVQPDGKLLAAGLVFFQVPSAASPGVLDVAGRLAAPAAGLGVLLLGMGAGIMLRRSKK
ncbi:MAG TPA: hypothetical protein VF937_09110 [Chloroflexota bacterium]